MAVVVLTSRSDATADLVVTELNRRHVPVFRADFSEFPTELALTAQLRDDRHPGWDVRMRQPQRNVNSSEVTGVWYRKPSEFTPVAGTATEQRWAAAEAKVAFGGVLPDLPEVRWVNPVYAMAASVPKPRQLAAAASAGLTVPPSIITNDPDAARSFCREQGDEVIYKPLNGAPRSERAGDVYELYATPLTTDQITDNIAHNAHLLQARVPCAYSARIVVVGRRVYAVRIDAPGQAVDWRVEHEALTYTEIAVPDHVRTGLFTILDAFGLVFCSSDWIVTPDDEWVFIGDLNPNGQWGWIPQLREPVTSALADMLTGKDTAA